MRKKPDMTCELTAEQHDRDVELVRAARDGSRAAFDALYEGHKRFVYNVGYRMLGSQDDAVDAGQTAFIQAYRALSRFRGESAFRSWLYRIAINSRTGMLRQEMRHSSQDHRRRPDQGAAEVWYRQDLALGPLSWSN